MAVNPVRSFPRSRSISNTTNGAKITKFCTALLWAALDRWAQSEYCCEAASGYRKAFFGPDLSNEFKIWGIQSKAVITTVSVSQ